jgi:hypothetical protein
MSESVSEDGMVASQPRLGTECPLHRYRYQDEQPQKLLADAG